MLKHILLFILIFFSKATFAQTTETLDADNFLCPDAKLLGPSMITKTCWSALFPMYIGGVRVGGIANLAPDGRNDRLGCACEDDDLGLPVRGVTLGLSIPKYLLTTTSAYCFPELGGLQLGSELGLVSRYMGSNEDMIDTDVDSTSAQVSYSWHLASFPLTRMLELFSAPNCFLDGYSTFDIMWISETIPFFYDSEDAFLAAPESIAFANPVAMAAAVADCLYASRPERERNNQDEMDKAFFAAGCWGLIYPLTDVAGTMNDTVEAKSLIDVKALFLLSRIGVMKRTSGEDALCEDKPMPILKKSDFKFQRLWPNSESESINVDCQDENLCANNGPEPGPDPTGIVNAAGVSEIVMNSINSTCTHPVGQSSFQWGIWRDSAISGSGHASTLVWKWSDCCVGLFGGN